MKKYLKHVIITIAAVSILWALFMNGCNTDVEPYEPNGEKVKDSMELVIDSLQRKYDSALLKIESLEVVKDGVITSIEQRKGEYNESKQKFTESDSDTAFAYIINFLDSAERKDIHFYIDTSKADSNRIRP